MVSEVYRCPDYTDEGEQYSYPQLLFRNDPQSKMGVLKVHFPDMGHLYLLVGTVYDTVTGLHIGIADHVYLYHRAHLPSETLYGDQERLHQ